MCQKSKMSLFTYEKLYWAYLDCRKNKRKTINALDFEIDFENNLRELLCELKTRKYRPGRSIFFAVDQPSLREIFAADFRDRIIHHLLVSEFLPFFEARFIADSYACRPGKGTHGAVRRLRRYMKSFRKNDYYYGQFDIKGFFMSIDQNILFSMLKAKLEKEFRCDRQKLEEILWLSRMIIFHKPSENYVFWPKSRLTNHFFIKKKSADCRLAITALNFLPMCISTNSTNLSKGRSSAGSISAMSTIS
jgi:retron-type reverse transcriptase